LRRLGHAGDVLLGWERLEIFSRGSPLQNARFIAGLSQEELATRVRTTRQTISALERGTSIPSVSLALALARALGCSVEELFANVDRG
jgi:putative transcriptional regulator